MDTNVLNELENRLNDIITYTKSTAFNALDKFKKKDLMIYVRLKTQLLDTYCHLLQEFDHVKDDIEEITNIIKSLEEINEE